jgi:hypothetical protein
MSNQIKSVPFVIKAGGAITLFLNGESMTVAIDHPNYSKIVDVLKTGQFEKLDHLINIARAVTSYAKGTIRIENGQIFYGNFAVHNTLTNRILSMMNEGFQFKHMLLFLENLMQNPSHRAVNETYTFLENHGLPITDDGCFLAYKAVRNNYTDMRTGTFDNHIGKTPSMPRNQVDENYEQDCSSGLHVGSLGYVIDFGHFVKGAPVSSSGNRLLIVKVNPRDVVSVPKYADHTKMRVSTYTVVDEIKDIVKELDKVVYTAKATSLTPDRDDDVVAPKAAVSSVVEGTAVDYDEGYSEGESDRIAFDAGEDGEYGSNRDYSRKGQYVRGYNAGFKGNSYNAPADIEEVDPYILDSAQEDNDYIAGVELGDDDYNSDAGYMENLSPSASEAFKDGYRDGFNGDATV